MSQKWKRNWSGRLLNRGEKLSGSPYYIKLYRVAKPYLRPYHRKQFCVQSSPPLINTANSFKKPQMRSNHLCQETTRAFVPQLIFVLWAILNLGHNTILTNSSYIITTLVYGLSESFSCKFLSTISLKFETLS